MGEEEEEEEPEEEEPEEPEEVEEPEEPELGDEHGPIFIDGSAPNPNADSVAEIEEIPEVTGAPETAPVEKEEEEEYENRSERVVRSAFPSDFTGNYAMKVEETVESDNKINIEAPVHIKEKPEERSII